MSRLLDRLIGSPLERASTPAEQRIAVVEHRDPTAATQVTTRYQTPGKPMISEWNAEQSIRMAYMANVIVYRCMQIKAQAVASCAFQAGLAPPSEPGAPAKTDPSSRLAQLLGPAPGGPAPKLTARRLWAWTVVQRGVTGRHGWEIEQAPTTKEVVALWPLVSEQLKAIPSTGGSDWWKGFTYGPDNQPKELTVDQVLYGWDPSANDFRQPESCLQAARLDISIAVMMGRYNYGFLRNDARPAAVVVTEAFDSDDDYRRFKHQWGGEFGGPDNAGKTAFVETSDEDYGGGQRLKPSEALNVHVLGLSQKDAQFIAQEKAALEKIAMACGVPWSRLDASERTFDNAGQEDETFWVGTMLPLLTDLADEVNIQLSPRLGREVGWFDLSHVKVFQPTQRVTAVEVPNLMRVRVTTVNEGREIVGLGPVEGGDRFLTDDEIAVIWGRTPATPPLGETTPTAAMLEVPSVVPLNAAAVVPAVEQRELEGEERGVAHTHMHTHADGTIHAHSHQHAAGVADHGDFPDGVTHAHAHDRSIEDEIRQAAADEERMTAEQHEQRRTALWHAADATVRTLEHQWERSMARLFDRQQRAVISRLEGNRGRRALREQRSNTDDLFDPDYWRAETEQAASDLYETVTAAGFARISALFGVAFDVTAEFAQKFIQARANQLAGYVTDTTYQAIQDQLAEGADAGETIAELADRIRHVFDVATTSRATTIARTEVISAYNGSTTAAAQQLPDDVAGGREWIATRDSRTRDDHAEADGEVVGMDESFDVGGESLDYPGDPNGDPANVVNCRCTVAILTPDEMAARGGLVGEERVASSDAADVLELLGDGDFDERTLRRALRRALRRHLPARAARSFTRPIVVEEPAELEQELATVGASAPVFNIHVDVHPSEPPTVNVAAPAVTVEPTVVNVEAPPASPAPIVNVEVARGATRKTVTHNDDGRITEIVETPVDE